MKNVKELERLIAETKKELIYRYFTKVSVFNYNDNDTESLRASYYEFEIDEDNNVITELPRDIELDWSQRLEADTTRNLIVIRDYSQLW